MKKRPQRIKPLIKIVMIKDPLREGVKMLVPPEFLTDQYIRIDKEEDFRKYFHPMYFNMIIPYLGTHYVGFIHKKHPFFIRSEHAILTKLDMIVDTGDETFINSLLKENGKNEKDMSIEELEDFIKNAKNLKTSRLKKEKLLKDSGKEKEIRRKFALRGKNVFELSLKELKELITEGGN